MEFTKYPSITNHYQTKHIQQCLDHQISDDWQVFEKIHGSNFAFYVKVDGTIKAASRNKLLTSEDRFHGFQDIIEQYREQLIDLAGIVGDCIVYCELFGSNVQREIKYGDKPMIRVFDIYLYHTEEFLSQGEVVQECNEVNLPVVYPSLRGTLEECLKFSPNFISAYSDSNDEAEGVVIKPSIPFVLPSGSMPWIKNKTEAFIEKKESKKPKERNNVPDPFELATFKAMVCLPRLANVKSKMTEDEMTIPNLANALFQDVIDDAVDEGIEWEDKYKKPVLGTCYKLVRENM